VSTGLQDGRATTSIALLLAAVALVGMIGIAARVRFSPNQGVAAIGQSSASPAASPGSEATLRASIATPSPTVPRPTAPATPSLSELAGLRIWADPRLGFVFDARTNSKWTDRGSDSSTSRGFAYCWGFDLCPTFVAVSSTEPGKPIEVATDGSRAITIAGRTLAEVERSARSRLDVLASHKVFIGETPALEIESQQAAILIAFADGHQLTIAVHSISGAGFYPGGPSVKVLDMFRSDVRLVPKGATWAAHLVGPVPAAIAAAIPAGWRVDEAADQPLRVVSTEVDRSITVATTSETLEAALYRFATGPDQTLVTPLRVDGNQAVRLTPKDGSPAVLVENDGLVFIFTVHDGARRTAGGRLLDDFVSSVSILWPRWKWE